MPTHEAKNESPLTRSVLKLDDDFSELERLSAQLDRLPLDSESAFEKAKHFLARFGDCSLRIGNGIQAMAAALEESRVRAEKAAELVATRAVLVQQRQQQNDKLLEAFRGIGEKVRDVTAEVALICQPEGSVLSPEERAALPEKLSVMDSQLGQLIEAAHSIKAAAREASLKTLETNADALEQSMKAARRRLTSALDSTREDPELVVRRDPKNFN